MSLRKLFAPQYALYYAAALLLAAESFLVVALDPLKYAIARFLANGGSLGDLPRYAITLLSPVHYFWVLALCALLVLLMRMEWKQRALSTGLQSGSDFSFRVFAAALFIWFAQAFLYPGILLGGDTGYHVSRIAHFRYGLEEGKFIFWNNYWHLGMPEYQFTGPLLFWLGGAVDLLFRNPYLSAKLMLFLAQIASGAFLYQYLRVLRIDRFAALLGAVAYCGAWTHLHMLLYKGVLPQAIIFALLPLGLLIIEKLAVIGRHATWYWPGLATVLAALFVTHPTNGFFAALYLALYALVNLLVGRFAWRAVPPMATAAVAAALMSLFLLIPIKLEQDWVTMTAATQMVGLKLPTLESLRYLVVWHFGNTGPGSNFFAYIGLSVIGLALMSLRALRSADREGKQLVIAVLILWVTSFFLVGPHVRQPIFILLFTAILAGIGAGAIAWNKGSAKPALLMLVVLLDIGVLAIQPLARTDKEYLARAADELVRNHPSARVLVANSYTGNLVIPIWGSGFIMGYKVQQLGLPYGYSVPLSHNYVAAVIKQAEQDLVAHRRLSDMTMNMLALINVDWIINDDGSRMGFSDEFSDAQADGVLGKTIHVRGATPVVFAAALLRRAPDRNLDKPVFWDDDFAAPREARANQAARYVEQTVSDMAYDAASHTAEKIFVRDLPPSDASGGTGRLTASMLEYKVDTDRVAIKIDSDGAGWARLAHAWYPALQVTHNGASIQPLQDVMGQIVVPVRPGANEYVIEPVLTDIRRVTLGISAAVLLGVWMVTWVLRRYSTRRKSADHDAA